MSRSVQKRPQAQRDLIECYEHIGQDRPSAADRFLMQAQRAFEQIARMPGIGSRWQSPLKALEKIRFWPIPKFRNFIVFYREIPDGVEILRVLHGARDIENALEAVDN
jgi:toxin ParE1/3/4